MKILKLSFSDTKKAILNPTPKIAKKEILKRILDDTDTFVSFVNTRECRPFGVHQAYKAKEENQLEKLINSIQTILNRKKCSPEEEKTLKNLIKTELSNIMRNENIIGVGFHETVYRLNDEYAVKLNPCENYDTVIDSDNKLVITDNLFPSLKYYMGGFLLKFGNFKILKNLGKHIPAGIPQALPEEQIQSYYREKYLPTFANVPQESYDNLIMDCAKLNEDYRNGFNFYCKIFDYINPNNIVLKDNKLFWVDVIRSSINDINSTSKILNVMLNKYKIGGNSWIKGGYGNSLIYAREIFKKIILAAADAGLPFLSCSDRFSNKILTNILHNLDIKINPDVLAGNIDKINKIKDKDLRTKETKKYLEELFSMHNT